MASGLASAKHASPRPFFGRQADLSYLLDSASSPGLTAVVGGPQVGKTRLLHEVRDRLIEKGFVVGYAESTGDGRDLLLHAVHDACARAFAAGELNVAHENAGAVSGILAHVSAAVLASALPGELRKTLGIAKRAAGEPEPTGLDPPTPSVDEALSLLESLVSAARRPIALIMDAWEKCSPLAPATTLLRRLLEHHDERTACHVFLGIELDEAPGHEAATCLTELRGSTIVVDVRRLGAMDLSDPTEHRGFLDYLAFEVPAVRVVGPAIALQLLDGRPGVLHRWLSIKPETPHDLERLADDARADQYPELRALFVEHCRTAPRVGAFLATLAVLPQMNDEAVWRCLSAVLLDDLGEATVSMLQADGTLERLDDTAVVPSYGHATRHEAARDAWLKGDEPVLRTVARSAIRGIVPLLAGRVTDLGSDSSFAATALAAIAERQPDLQLKASTLLLCEYAASLFSPWAASLDVERLGAEAVKTVRDSPQAENLISLALANMEQTAGRQGNRVRGDVLLENLGELCAAHPDVAVARECLAAALASEADRASGDDRVRRDAMLLELHELTIRHAGDAAVREHLAIALAGAVGHASRRSEGTDRDMLLNALRRLHTGHPGDPAVRRRLAMALVDAAGGVHEHGLQIDRNEPLEELRGLQADHPGDAAVREQLAIALVNTVDQACRERHPACRDSLLEELRRLHAEHPGDAAVRERLALALASALDRAVRERQRAWHDRLLGELLELSAEHPADAPVRRQVGYALYDSVVHLYQAKDRARRDALLDELRELCARHPDDVDVHERLTAALFNMPMLPLSDRD